VRSQRESNARDDLSCSVQGWACFGRNPKKTWRVDGVTTKGQPEAKARPGWDQSVLDDPATAALLQMEDEEEARLLREEQEWMSLSNELEHDENTDWLRGCGWPRWYANKPLHHNETETVAEGESSHARSMRRDASTDATSHVLLAAKLGLALLHVSLELPQRGATRSRYRSYLNRFLCYVCRSWQVCETMSRSLGVAYGLELSEVQAQRMKSHQSAHELGDEEPLSSSSNW
jgi:hypothetical protein